MMTLNKIISGAQTGADRAALDAAIGNSIPHGGWVPKGRKSEDGTVPERYKVTETKSSDYRYRTELNVKESNGTVIFTHGKLKGGSLLTQKCTIKHNRPCLHYDLNETLRPDAIKQISQWIADHQIGVLNCAGSRASKDPEIYAAVFDILEAVIYLEKMKVPGAYGYSPEFELKEVAGELPETLDSAATAFMNLMSSRDKFIVAGTDAPSVKLKFFGLGMYLRNNFGLWVEGSKLLEDCRNVMGNTELQADDASNLILEEAWRKCGKKHKRKNSE